MATDGRTTEFRGDSGGQHDRLERLGKYQIRRRLGAGGMGTVFLAVDQQLNRTVALKVLPKERAENPTLVKRFKMEAQAAAQLEHKNIVRVYEAGEAQGFLYIALEYVEGIDVHELVAKRGVLPVRRSIDIVRQIAKALDHAASKQIVHRDIKPANLMIKRDGTVKLADMGLARSIDEATETNITRAGMTVGTVDYMSPEQARSSQAADVRSDLYSLGCTWYHMLTGEPPFPDGGLTEKLQAHALAKRPDPRTANEAVPEAVVAVLHRMMARKPADRYQTPQELLEDLELASRSLNALNATGLEALAEESGSPVRRKARGRSDSGPATLPPKDGFKPVDLVSGRTIDIDVLRFAIPAVLVVALLGVLVWVVRQGDDDELRGNLGTATTFPPERRQGESINDESPAERDPDADAVPPAENQVSGLIPETPPQVVEIPFPGAEDAATTSEGVRLIPNWVSKFRSAPLSHSQTLVVTRRAEGKDRFRRLNEAIGALPREGGGIELDGDGPFLLEPATIAGRGKVRIAAAEGRHPVVYFSTGGATNRVRGYLTVRTPELELEDLHFVMVDPPSEDVSMLVIEGGDVSLRNCSISVDGAQANAITAIDVSGSLASAGHRSAAQPAGGRCLLENVVCRGDRLTAVHLRGGAGELVAGNCLLHSGDAPAIVLTDSGEQVAGGRSLRLLATTIISNDAAVRFVHTGDRPPTACDVVARKSVLGMGGAANDAYAAAMIRLEGWPENAADIGSSRATAVDWSTEETLYLGWPNLVAMQSPDGSAGSPVATADEWRRFWDKALTTDAVAAAATPLPTWEQPAVVEPQEVSLEVGAAIADPELSSRVGFRSEDLGDMPLGMIEHVIVASRTPTTPEGFGEGLPVDPSPITFDLMKRSSLDNFLKSDACPDGTHVIATGTGLRKTGPLEIVDKAIRLEFRQTGSSALNVQFTSDGADGATPQAAIMVRNGALDLVGARFKLPATNDEQPNWMLQIENARVSVRGSTLEGPSTPAPGHSGLIHFAGDETEPSDGTACVSIEDSFLFSHGPLIAGSIRFDTLVLRNSVLVSQREALTIHLDEAGLRRQSSVVVNHCTFAGGTALFRFDGELPSETDLPPINVIVAESVFTGTPGGSAEETTVAWRDSESLTERFVRWWGSVNGFSPTLKRYVVTDDRPEGPASPIEDWTAAWGRGHELHPLSGPTDVLFAEPFPEWTALKPSHFELSATSPAAVGASDGSPIGADVATVGASRNVEPDAGKGPPEKPSRAPGKPSDRSRNRNLF